MMASRASWLRPASTKRNKGVKEHRGCLLECHAVMLARIAC